MSTPEGAKVKKNMSDIQCGRCHGTKRLNGKPCPDCQATSLEKLAREAEEELHGPSNGRSIFQVILAVLQRAVAEKEAEWVERVEKLGTIHEHFCAKEKDKLAAQLAEQKDYADEYIRQTDAQIDRLAAQLAEKEAARLVRLKEHEPHSLNVDDGIERLIDSLGTTIEERISLTAQANKNAATCIEFANENDELGKQLAAAQERISLLERTEKLALKTVESLVKEQKV